MSRITFEVPQSKHPFAGLGTGIIITENGTQEPRIIIKFPIHGIEIVTATGDNARSIIAELNEEECFNADRIEYAKNVACKILRIDNHLLYIKGKKEKPVFARWLVWNYAKNKLNMTLEECGALFQMEDDVPYNHSSVISALKHFDDNNIEYLLGWQKMAYADFWREMKEYIL